MPNELVLLDIGQQAHIASQFDNLARIVALPMLRCLDYPRRSKKLDAVRAAIEKDTEAGV